MTETVAGCAFCGSSGLTLWRGDALGVLLDPAPIVLGHLLVFSASHYPSAADVPATVAVELDRVCAHLRDLYLAEFGAYTMFEHGRTGHCLRRRPEERICHHAHIHVLPLAGDLTGHVDLGQRCQWQSWTDVADLAGEIDGYVVVETVGSGRIFYPVTHALPPHYLRTAAARLVGDERLADWEQVIDWPSSTQRVAAARERLGGLIAPAVRAADRSP